MIHNKALTDDTLLESLNLPNQRYFHGIRIFRNSIIMLF
jgi:hypothetical protein